MLSPVSLITSTKFSTVTVPVTSEKKELKTANYSGVRMPSLARTCVGKLTYFSASYWHQLDMMFEKEQKEYLNRGACNPINQLTSSIAVLVRYISKLYLAAEITNFVKNSEK
jgi:hypothetical protein